MVGGGGGVEVVAYGHRSPYDSPGRNTIHTHTHTVRDKTCVNTAESSSRPKRHNVLWRN